MRRSHGIRLLYALTIPLLAGACASTVAPAPQRPSAPQPSASQARAVDCFPFERLPVALRARASQLLLNALDGEGLYSIAADIKPISSGFFSTEVTVAKPDLREADEVRQILQAWTCGGEIVAGLHHFAAVYEGRRPLEAVVFNLPALRRMLAQRQEFFAPYGVSPATDPTEALMAIEYDPTTARLRGYGYFFGYPEYAVDFFARAADEQKVTGTLVPRDFLSLPTARGERRFVYATPKGHQPNAADQALRTRVDAVFADYMARRAKHVTENDGAGILKLVREWFDDGRGNVRPSNVWARPSGDRVGQRRDLLER